MSWITMFPYGIIVFLGLYAWGDHQQVQNDKLVISDLRDSVSSYDTKLNACNSNLDAINKEMINQSNRDRDRANAKGKILGARSEDCAAPGIIKSAIIGLPD